MPAASITTSAPCARARLGAEGGRERAPLRPRADPDRPAAGVGDAGAEHQPDRPEPDHRDRVAGRDAGRLDAVQAAGERLDHRRELGRHPRRDGEEVRPRDPLGHEDELGVGAVEQREEVLAQRLLPAPAGRAAPQGAELAATTRRPVATSTPQNSCPNGLGGGPSSTGCPRRNAFRSVPSVSATSTWTSTSPVGLRLRPRHLLEPQVAGAVEDERPHRERRAAVRGFSLSPGRPAQGTNTTFSTDPSRNSASPSSNRSSGSDGRAPAASSSGRSADRLPPCEPASPTASRSPSARAGRRAPRAGRRRRRRASTVPPGSTAVERRRRRRPGRRGRRRRPARPGASAGPRRIAVDREDRVAAPLEHRAEEAPDEAVADDEHAPARDRSAPRRTQASGSTYVPRASSTASGSSTQPVRPHPLGEPAGHDRRLRERARRSTRARDGSGGTSPQLRWWIESDAPAVRRCGRRPRARARCPARASPIFSTSEPQSPQASTSTSSPSPAVPSIVAESRLTGRRLGRRRASAYRRAGSPSSGGGDRWP